MSKKAESRHKYFADQMDDEDVLLVFRRHPIVMRKGLILAMLAILLGTIPGLIKPEYSFFFGGLAVGVVVGLLVLLPAWIGWYYSVFVITTQRMIQITQKGLFHRSVVDIGLGQIQMVNYEVAGLEQTMLGFGTIMMQTYLGDLVIHDIHHPAKIQKQLLGILRDQGVLSGGGFPQATGRDEQVTEEEYEAEA